MRVQNINNFNVKNNNKTTKKQNIGSNITFNRQFISNMSAISTHTKDVYNQVINLMEKQRIKELSVKNKDGITIMIKEVSYGIHSLVAKKNGRTKNFIMSKENFLGVYETPSIFPMRYYDSEKPTLASTIANNKESRGYLEELLNSENETKTL